jgi:hypothetical protein
MTNNEKWSQLLEYIVNDESDKAKGLFHEIVVAESRSIYADILESDVEEAMHDDDMDENVDGNEVETFIDEVEAEEYGDETVEAAGDDMEDSMEVSDDDADEDMGDEDMGDEDMGDEAGEEGEEMEDRVADLENALDELKAEFDELMSQEENEPEHSDMGGDDMGMDSDEGEMDMSSSDDMANELDEFALSEGVEMSKVAAVSNSESGVNSKSIVAKKNDFGGKAVKFDQGGDETGGKVSAPSQHMGQSKYANSAGQKNVKMDNAPKAQTREPAGVMSKPILGK